jgi:hypothetical protein
MWFKIALFLTLISGLLSACSPMKKTGSTSKPEKLELIANNQDSTEYELIIIDVGFQSWFESHRQPIWYYSKDYLATMNNQYVIAWNEHARNSDIRQADPDNPFIMEIDYRPNIDYGLELNYKLYWYFQYVEATWGKILLYDRRK